jgi:hypothetical protein
MVDTARVTVNKSCPFRIRPDSARHVSSLLFYLKQVAKTIPVADLKKWVEGKKLLGLYF